MRSRGSSGKASQLIVALSLFLLAPSAHAADWGPLVEEILDHLAEHMAADVANSIVEHATRGEPLPELIVTQSMLQQAAFNQVTRCLQRAKWLDDNSPEISVPAQGAPPRIPFGYASELHAFHENCDSVLTRK